MPTLFTPWRYAYIGGQAPDSCIFCNAVESDDEAAVLRLSLTKEAILMLNRYPYTNGHLMVAPRRHTAEITTLTQEEQHALWDLVNRGVDALNRLYHPQGYNIGMNLGRVAGAGVEDHLHIHIVPRWNGDHNFMRTLASTRLIPEALADSHTKLKEALGS